MFNMTDKNQHMMFRFQKLWSTICWLNSAKVTDGFMKIYIFIYTLSINTYTLNKQARCPTSHQLD